MDKQRLIKLLELSSSSNDNEVLSTIKKANELIREHKLNWKDIVENNNSSRTKEQNIESVISYMNLQRERLYLDSLKDEIFGLKKIIKYLGIVVIILFVLLMLK